MIIIYLHDSVSVSPIIQFNIFFKARNSSLKPAVDVEPNGAGDRTNKNQGPRVEAVAVESRKSSISDRLKSYGKHAEITPGGDDLQTPEEELDSWLDLPIKVVDTEKILEYWVEVGKSYPHVASAALFLNKIPCSSIPSERVFSQSGRVVSDPRRASLSSAKLNMFCVVNSNSDLLSN